MKKLSILFLSVMTLGLSVASCSSDDDDNNGGSIEGKWQLSEVGVFFNGEEALEPATNDGCDNDIMEFKTDGKFIDSYSEFTNDKCTAYTQEGTWTKDGSTLTKKYASDDEEKLEVAELTGSKLKLKFTYSEGGITISAVQVYKKI